jgi:hypothetical protein
MENLSHILTGGFAKGYRTYLMAGLMVATALVSWMVGDSNFTDMVQHIAEGLGIGTLRAAV